MCELARIQTRLDKYSLVFRSESAISNGSK
jgi:hypothetical protein